MLSLLINFIKTFFCFLLLIEFSFAQTCGSSQSLSSIQQNQINLIAQDLETAYANEHYSVVDSICIELKSAFANEAGKPDAVENYYNLTTNNSWLTLSEALNLSRLLIDNDSSIYRNLWKVAKGMAPTN